MMRKHEEQRLYFLYLDELRAQQHRNHTQYDSLHEQQPQQQSHHVPSHHLDPHHRSGGTDGGYIDRSPHHHQEQDQHHDKNAFQRTEQWVDRMVQQHQENVGHWENRPGDQRAESTNSSVHSIVVDGSGGYQMSHNANISITTGDSNSCAKPNIALDQPKASSSTTSQPAAEQPKPTEPSEGNYGGDGGGGGGGNIGEV
uniref:Uncharacterized protein n=1 Tax=Anopheles maculatus TaxID=74869 RepID=A0A182SYN7_9DIPT